MHDRAGRLDKTDLEEILDRARRGSDFAEIFIESRETTRIGCEARQIERVISGVEQGAGIRAVRGDRTAYGYSNALDRESLLQLADQVSRAAGPREPAPQPPAAGAGRPSAPDPLERVPWRPAPIQSEAAPADGGGAERSGIRLQPRESPVSLPVARRPDSTPVADKVALVRAAEEAAWSTDEKLLRQVTVGYADTVQRVVIANTEGVYVEDERVRCRMSVNAVAAEGAVIQTGYESAGGTKGMELFNEEQPAELGRRAAQRALMMLKARRAPAGRMTVVLSGEAGGTMIHEACGHGLEADLVQKQLSVYAGKKGQKVASELVTVVDDGTLPGRFGSYRFDDEGNPARKTVLIERGILRGYMYDHITAARDGVEPTGNGRRESFQHRPIPRMSTTYLAPGDTPPEEIIRRTEAGLLVRRMGGGQVNTTNGDFVFDVPEGYLIENGEVTVPVRGATLTGNGPEVLQQIDMVGSDFGFSLGICGKEGQGVPVADAQPTIRIPSLVVGGIIEEENGKEAREGGEGD